MSIVEKLLAEEKEAEEQMYGKEPAEEQAQSTDEESAPEGESTEYTSEDTVKPKRENWKKRYIGYKTATDETIRDLRDKLVKTESRIFFLEGEVNTRNEEIESLRNSIPPKDPFEGVFTEEDKNLLGEEALAAMKKAALATKGEEKKQIDPEVAQLKRELQEWKKREAEKTKQDSKALHDKKMDELREKLGRLVPTFEQTDEDPKFGEYLNDIDDLSGQIRFELFERAVNTYDVANVARFYKEYAQSLGQRESFIDEYITPEGDGATQDSPERNAKRRYHISEYVAFMDDVTKGHYKGREREAQKLELMFDKAITEGRVYE